MTTLEFYRDDDGDWEYSDPPSWYSFLCADSLERFFRIPAAATRIWIVVSKEPARGMSRVRFNERGEVTRVNDCRLQRRNYVFTDLRHHLEDLLGCELHKQPLYVEVWYE